MKKLLILLTLICGFAKAQIPASFLTATATKTTAYNAQCKELVVCDASAGSFTVTLPTSPNEGCLIGIKSVSVSSSTVTIKCGGTNKIDKAGGATTVLLNQTGQASLLQYKSSNGIWYEISSAASGAILAGYVPYTGATGSVNLGTNTFSAGNATFSNVIANGTQSVVGNSTLANVFSAGTASFSGGTSTLTGLQNNGAITSTGAVTSPTFYGSSASGGNLVLGSTSNATKGSITLGAGSGTTSIPAGQTFSLGAANLTGGNTGTVAVLTDNYFTLTSSFATQVLSASTSYYWSTNALGNRTTVDQSTLTIPYNCTLVGASICSWNAGSTTSQTNSVLNFRLNGSDNIISSAVLWNTGSCSNCGTSINVTGLNVSVAAGDRWENKLTLGALATPPNNGNVTVTYYFARR